MSMPPKLELYDQLACEEIYFRNSTIITLPQPSRPFSQHSAAVHPPLASLGNFVLPTESVPSTLKTTEDLIYVTADPPASDKDSPTLPNGPDNDKLCHSPPVLAASAALQMRLIVTTGILSVLTTGWYSSISDRYGRTAILRVAILGLLMQDLLIIIIGHVSRDRLPLGNDFLMIGAVFEGVVGGYPTLAAAHQAYIADSTPAGTRAQVFGFFMALLFAGFAIGPTLGGWLVSKTGSLMSAFYLATAAHLIYTIVIYFVIPESSSRHTMDKAQKDHALQLRIKEEKWEATYKDRSKLAKWSAIAWERVQAPLLPLKMLLPKRIYADEDEDEVGPTQATPLLRRTGPITHGQEASASHISVSHISRKKRWDMNLTLLSLGNFTETMVIGIMASKMLYGQQMFNWGAREIGTYMTASSLGRVLALSLVLPLVIKLVHPPKKRLNLPQDADASGRDLLDHEGRPKSPAPSRDYGSIESTKERGPNNNGRATAASSSSSADANEDRDLEDSTETDAFLAKSWTEHERSVEEMWTLRAKHLRMIHDSKFDLRLARTSVLIMLITYAALPFAKDGLTYILHLLCCEIREMLESSSVLGASWVLSVRQCSALSSSPTSSRGRRGLRCPMPSSFSLPVSQGACLPNFATFSQTTLSLTGLFALSLLFLLLVRVRKTRSLPPLPPRPQSRPTSVVFPEGDVPASRDSTLGPMSSTKSQVRMKKPALSSVFADRESE
jgi:Major Facilitator Superfamily